MMAPGDGLIFPGDRGGGGHISGDFLPFSRGRI